MPLKFESLDRFIKEYYLHFLNIDVHVFFKKNNINISCDAISFSIMVWDQFYLDSNLDFSFLMWPKIVTKNLLDYLNKNVTIPLSLKLRKEIGNIKEKSVFILWSDGNVGNISENNLKLLKHSDILFTNNKEGVISLLKSLNIENKKVFLFSDIYFIELKNISEIILFQYWDYFELDQEINRVCCFLEKYFDRFFIQPYYSNFINKYSLSHTNYWSLLYLWSYDNGRYRADSLVIRNKIIKFIENTDKIISKFTVWSMMSLSGLSIEFKLFDELATFIDDIKDILNNYYLVELLLETKDWYINSINYANKLDYSQFRNESGISDITVFIYPKIWESFVWYYKYNLNNDLKSLTFLSAPLSNISEFTDNSLKELWKSKYIYGESLEWLKKFLDSLKITYFDKELFYWDDLKLVWDYKKEDKKQMDKLNIVPKVFPELIRLLDYSKKIYFLTDGWAPCILDPGDYIKKYINLNYWEYSVIWIKWPSVLSTVLLWSVFEYKYIYWAPLNYTISVSIDYLEEINFFSNDNFKDTLMIFYSFWKNFEGDLLIFEKIFDKNIKIQIIWDIWTEREYNKVCNAGSLHMDEINYISNSLVNIVYLLAF